MSQPVTSPAPDGAGSVEDQRWRRPSRTRSIRLGELRISYVADGFAQLKPRGWLPATTEGDWIAHRRHLDDTGHLVASFGGLLVEHGERALLIDAGLGPVEFPADPADPRLGALRGGELLASLARLGRRPEEIEAVAFTHLHLDHVGWAHHPVPGTGRLAFAGADHLVHEAEWDRRHLVVEHGTTEEMLAALAPRVRTVADGQEVFPGVRTLPTPGHTAGHTAFEITSGGERLIAFGDALHSAVQVGRADWSAAVDHDPVRSAHHRHHLVAELQRPDTVGFGVHFADVVFGRVRPGADGPVWHPEP